MLYTVILTLLFTPLATYSAEKLPRTQETDTKFDHAAQRIAWIDRFTIHGGSCRYGFISSEEGNKRYLALLERWSRLPFSAQNNVDDFFKSLESLTLDRYIVLPNKKRLRLECKLDTHALSAVLNAFGTDLGVAQKSKLRKIIRNESMKLNGANKLNALSYQLFITKVLAVFRRDISVFSHLRTVGIGVITLPLPTELMSLPKLVYIAFRSQDKMVEAVEYHANSYFEGFESSDTEPSKGAS